MLTQLWRLLKYRDRLNAVAAAWFVGNAIYWLLFHHDRCRDADLVRAASAGILSVSYVKNAVQTWYKGVEKE